MLPMMMMMMMIYAENRQSAQNPYQTWWDVARGRPAP